jgi:hypothetical protein
MHDFFIHAHEWAVRKGLFPRFECLSHVRVEWLTFEKWLVLEIKPFLESKPFSPKSA